MCGICGELRLDGAPADLDAIQRMMHELIRRGPDHGGSYSDGPLSFGHRRLSIIDLSVRSNQPMVDAELGLGGVWSSTGPSSTTRPCARSSKGRATASSPRATAR